MKSKGIILVVILSLASIMMPFTVYADSITSSNINGISVVLDEVTYIETISYQTSSGSINTTRNVFLYKAEIQLDKSYLGYIDITLNYQYNAYFGPTNGYVLTNGTKVQKVFVNGDKANLSFSFITNNTADPLVYSNITYTLNSSDLIEYGLISDIQTIIDILQENQDIITDIDAELETVVINTSLANDYLETLTKMKTFNIPIESYAFNMYSLFHNRNLFDYNDLYDFQYPIFEYNSNKNIYEFPSQPNQELIGDYTCVLGVSSAFGPSAIGNNLSLNDGEFLDIQIISRGYLGTSTLSSSRYFQFIKFRISNFTTQSVNALTTLTNNKFIFIYFGYTNFKNVSTDFALRWGLSNQLLDDLHIIAQGTNQSNSAASDLESGNDQMADDMDDLATIENGYNQQFNNQLQQIDFSSPLQSNAGILPAANFVITIFNGLINNNPFSVLIIIVCILLIGKKVIGK